MVNGTFSHLAINSPSYVSVMPERSESDVPLPSTFAAIIDRGNRFLRRKPVIRRGLIP